jgi:hypothetical protein
MEGRDGHTPQTSRRLLRRSAVLVVLAWSVVVVYLLLAAATDLRQGRRAATIARGELAPDRLASGRADVALRVAGGRFHNGAAHLGNPLLAPVRVVPVVGRQLRSAHALATAGARMATAARTAVVAARPLLDDPPEGGAGRVAAARRLATIAARAKSDLRDVPLGPEVGLVRPLAEARIELADELTKARDQVGRASTAGAALADFLTGPRRYLLLAANNAEMRAGAGMFLSAGVLEVRDGELTLGEVVPTGDLRLEEGGVAPEGDLAALWGWANPGREWRNLMMSPRFEASAALAAQMWEARGEPAVDGVLAIDVPALSGLLTATGPVEVDGSSVTSEGVLPLLLHDQYEGLTYDVAKAAEQNQRRERLGAIARAVVAEVQAGDVDLAGLTGALGDAAAGRHLLAWSRRADEQEAWRAAGVTGELEPDSLLLAVLNRGGNKLDPYLDVDATVRTRRRSDGATDVIVDVVLTNGTPEGQPPYIAGPRPDEPDLVEGEYVGLVALSMPGAARDVELADPDRPQVLGRDGATQVVARNVEILRGEQRRVSYDFVLPKGHERVVVEAGARVRPTTWHVGRLAWTDARPRRVIVTNGPDL